jgi:hypothetical protein
VLVLSILQVRWLGYLLRFSSDLALIPDTGAVPFSPVFLARWNKTRWRRSAACSRTLNCRVQCIKQRLYLLYTHHDFDISVRSQGERQSNNSVATTDNSYSIISRFLIDEWDGRNLVHNDFLFF